ncbi:MAG: DUF3592 domain-containing protein [Chloroherpetonaceae bacterium]|nr:DUF3592 domain-containing protein [Chloroherpetonaceae bacterium]
MQHADFSAIKVTGVALALMAALWFGGAFYVWRKQQTLSQIAWQETTGKITRSEFIDDSEGGTTKIEYAYEVQGKRYASSRVVLDYSPYNSAQLAKKYPANAEVRVYYDPNNPEAATLETQVSYSFAAILLGAGIVCLAIGAFLLN